MHPFFQGTGSADLPDDVMRDVADDEEHEDDAAVGDGLMLFLLPAN